MRLLVTNPDDRKLLERLKDPLTGKSQLELQVEHERNRFNNSANQQNISEINKATKTNSKARNNTFYKDGVYWHSNWEYSCWMILLDLKRKGVIFEIERQKKFTFVHNGILLFSYIADFVIIISEDSTSYYVLDSKSTHTQGYQKFKWQKNAMKAFYDKDVVCLVKNQTNIEQTILDLKLKEK